MSLFHSQWLRILQPILPNGMMPCNVNFLSQIYLESSFLCTHFLPIPSTIVRSIFVLLINAHNLWKGNSVYEKWAIMVSGIFSKNAHGLRCQLVSPTYRRHTDEMIKRYIKLKSQQFILKLFWKLINVRESSYHIFFFKWTRNIF